MKRSRAFILTEQLMTMLLQAGFILVLCMSFYMLTTFYAQTQQIMTARNHAERVISFVDNKIRYAGLGLWRCGNSETIATRLSNINMLSWTHYASHGYKLPVSLKWDTNHKDREDIPLQSNAQTLGSVLTLLYAQRDLSAGGDYEVISAFAEQKNLDTITTEMGNYSQYLECKNISLLDTTTKGHKARTESKLFSLTTSENDIRKYALMESVGLPMYLVGITASSVTLRVYEPDYSKATQLKNVVIPAGGELMGLSCMQMFVHGTDAGEGRQFAYRELQASGNEWNNTYNQEKGILDIYMERDNDSNTFTLWVLATGGYDASLNNSRPETWPKDAHPTESEWGTGDYSTYPHHIVYVSRASWKLNNLEGFSW